VKYEKDFGEIKVLGGKHAKEFGFKPQIQEKKG
jgi:hypothetical protein